MGERRKTRNQLAHPQGGRPPRLMETPIREKLIEAIALGVPISIACSGVGIAEQSYRNWLNRGKAEHEACAEEEREPSEDEQLYLDFYLEVLHARSQAAFRNVGIIQKVAQGGTVIERTTETYTDSDGHEVTKETVKRQQPDWRAAAWYLERAHRSEYGKDAVAVEVSGPDGGPVAFASVEEELANRLQQFVAEGVPTLALTATQVEADASDDGEVHEGEVLEEPTF